MVNITGVQRRRKSMKAESIRHFPKETGLELALRS